MSLRSEKHHALGPGNGGTSEGEEPRVERLTFRGEERRRGG